MNQTITMNSLERFEKAFDADSGHAVAMHAATENGVLKASRNAACNTVKLPAFSIELETGKVCDQKHSGRCWMFASLNVMRLDLMKKWKLENVELSQAYPFFYDKLERSNHFLENILETLDEETGSRVLSHLLSDPMGDGGQWDMFRCLVDKYGVVPQDVMPDTASCRNSTEMNRALTRKLREYACTLRGMAKILIN